MNCKDMGAGVHSIVCEYLPPRRGRRLHQSAPTPGKTGEFQLREENAPRALRCSLQRVCGEMFSALLQCRVVFERRQGNSGFIVCTLGILFSQPGAFAHFLCANQCQGLHQTSSSLALEGHFQLKMIPHPFNLWKG